MSNEPESGARRDFLKSLALATVAAGAEAENAFSETEAAQPPHPAPTAHHESTANVSFPRVFTGPELAMISFPLGGIGAGSIGLGGRGQLRDWEIFNRADKGNSPAYAFPSIWLKEEGKKPITRVLEARILTPYEGQDGLGSQNAPGLSRLEGATFTGAFPLASIEFNDRRLPVTVKLEAGTPFIPLDADESGLPIAVLRYRVRNRSKSAVIASIAFSIENPVTSARERRGRRDDGRTNTPRRTHGLEGMLMQNPALDKLDEGNGSFVLALLNDGAGKVTSLRGWPAGPWWNSPLLFWDDFSEDGQLGPEAEKIGPVAALCLKRSIAPGAESEYTFLLAWHFPNRTPARCGWSAPKGHENDVIGNWYANRFPDAWAAAEYAASNLSRLEQRTRQFVTALRETTVPPEVKEAASANLSTLVSTTCFRTADGEFHGFEGVDDHIGCCSGNCTHVWNYETSTAHLFPSLSHSLRRSAFGYSMDDRGAMSFRQMLPDGFERSGFAAADGQMGQIIKVFLDWQLSGDMDFLRQFWPKAKRAIEFAWISGGWDENRDGVFEGVQHNTYDVEFYGPNPMCGAYYLGALRAAEEMARAVGDNASANEYRRLFENGSKWIDEHLFNGEYYVQQVQGRPAADIAAGLRVGAGAADPEHPQYQLGDGCLVDQLVGQYLAEVAGLGPLLKKENVRKTLDSIYRYNHKAKLAEHDTVQRTFALNDEAAMVICDYGKGQRPKIPFPYFAEVMTGFEYSAATLMLYNGLLAPGLECIADIRRRYDGVRRSPWDEAECGHHYARAMAAWSGLLALSGFRYRGADRRVIAAPRIQSPRFHSLWSAGTAWGVFTVEATARQGRLSLSVMEGTLPAREVEFPSSGTAPSTARLGLAVVEHRLQRKEGRAIVTLAAEVNITPANMLVVEA